MYLTSRVSPRAPGLREVQALILEYESGFRAGEREQHTERRASEFFGGPFGGGRYALPARARAFFTSGSSTPLP